MIKASDNVGIELLTVFGLDPVEHVKLAAGLGCRHVGMALTPLGINPNNYPGWSLREDAALRRDFLAAMRDNDVSVSLAEGFLILPGVDIRDRRADIDSLRELGATRFNTLALDPDPQRRIDQLAAFAEMAEAVGGESTLEFGPMLGVTDLPGALAILDQVGRDSFRLLIDCMHICRSGSSPADLAAVDPDKIGYVQICDAPLVSKFEVYADEAKFERLAPGEGELPLLDMMRALPKDRVFGLEIPMREKALAGIGPRERIAPCVAAARDLLDRASE